MKTPEGRVKDEIKKFLREIGAYYFCPVQQGFGQQTLDILGSYKGRFFAIECKREGLYPTARQMIKMQEIRKSDGLAFCAWSAADVKEQFTAYFAYHG